MAVKRTQKHTQSKLIVDINDLLTCIKEVESVEYLLGLNECGEVVKIQVSNLTIVE